ncbi:MAG: hypothetical protein H7X99_08880 [Saprospiraceae bacterium]|nr:hypothetical protein [Saprospiraceae bacterium]
MKSRLLIFAIFIVAHSGYAQDSLMVKVDSMHSCSTCYSNIVSFGGKYYFNTLENTRTTLRENGFLLDQEAFEYQLRIHNFPKIFYYQQLGTLTNTNYASVTGFGLKEDIRFRLIKNSNFILTPYVELGGGYYRMNIVKGVTSNSVSSVLGSEVENYFLDNFVLSGDVGLDVGYGFDVEGKRFSIIVNGGFISNYPTEWKLAGSLAFKEKIHLTSPYAGVTLRLDMACNESCCK